MRGFTWGGRFLGLQLAVHRLAVVAQLFLNDAQDLWWDAIFGKFGCFLLYFLHVCLGVGRMAELLHLPDQIHHYLAGGPLNELN